MPSLPCVTEYEAAHWPQPCTLTWPPPKGPQRFLAENIARVLIGGVVIYSITGTFDINDVDAFAAEEAKDERRELRVETSMLRMQLHQQQTLERLEERMKQLDALVNKQGGHERSSWLDQHRKHLTWHRCR